MRVLDKLARVFVGQDQSVTRVAEQFWLRSRTFDGMANASEVRNEAVRITEALSGLSHAQPTLHLAAMTASKANGFGMARRLHARALDEYRAASAVNDRIGIRQAAEKGWLSSVEATKALLRARGRLAPGGTGRQRDELVKLGRANKKARDLPRLFALARETLHISCFYDDEFTPATIEAVLEDAGELIGLAEKVAASR